VTDHAYASPTDVPDTRFARLGSDRIAYQVLGTGPNDLVYMSSMGECIDLLWEWEPAARFLRRLASFSRVILFDRRGVGASDPVPLNALPTWEEWAADALAVLDAVGSQQAAFIGWADSGLTAILIAATQRDRTRALILGNSTARMADQDAPGPSQPEDDTIEFFIDSWGTEPMAARSDPDMTGEPAFLRWNAKMMRLACTRRAAGAYMQQMRVSDVRQFLPAIRVPTLVVHRDQAELISLAHGQYLAEHIDAARFVVVPGTSLTMYNEPTDPILDRIEEFLTGTVAEADVDRVLAAVLFTDIVASTERAVAIGDRQWRALLESHDAIARAVVDHHGGKVVKLTGDGVLATFDGPGRAIRAALALRDALEPLGVHIRAGLHTGEIESRGEDIGGIGVHVAARVLEHAGPDELLTSPAVPLLVAGSGIRFEDRGQHQLKGIAGMSRLYAVKR
jgi:class 3 adenylate cyclase